MPRIEFTEEQKRAIHYNGKKPAVVSAAAGSGKTAVLVERVMTMISEEERGIDAGGLAVVTFTEKATAELTERLNERLSALVEMYPDNEYIKKQQIRFGDAIISTISGFCRRLLDENIEQLSLSQGFGVVSESEKVLIEEEAVHNIAARAFKDGYEEIYRRIGDERALSVILRKMHDFAANLPDEESWFKEQVKCFSDTELYCESFYNDTLQEKLDTADRLLSELTKMNELLSATDDAKKKCDDIANVIGALRIMREGISENDFEPIKEAGNRLSEIGNACRAYKGEAPFEHERYKMLRAEAKDFIKASDFFTDPDAERVEAEKTALLIIRLYREFKAEYSALKQEKNVADFSDFEQLTLQMLRSSRQVREKIRNEISYIIVDEFQDSNDQQYEIFKLISREEKNLYFVGDIKQSIYGFRGANPQVFANLLNNRRYEQLYMNINFRSSDDVINVTNDTFRCGVCRSFNGGTPWLDMVGGRKLTPESENAAELVEITYGINKNAEVEYIAKRIFEMVRDGYEICIGKEKRPCCYGDFAVLMRSESSKREPMRRALNVLGIPNVTKGESSFTDLTETRLVVNLLRSIINPYDSRSLAALMMSPMFLFTADEMAQIKTLYGVENARTRSEIYAAVKTISAKNTPLGKKCAAFIHTIGVLRKQRSDCTLPQLLRRIYSETDLLSVMNIGWNGNERVANLYLLLNYAESYCKIFGDDAEGFAAFISGGKGRGARLEMEQAAIHENEENSVRIMTIHGSKGLQFPVVFVANLNAKKNERDYNDAFLADIETGFGPAIINNIDKTRVDSAAFKTLRAKMTDKNNGEELRLLYVSMTRAEQKLIMTAGCKRTTDDVMISAGSLYEFLKSRQASNGVFKNTSFVNGDALERPDASGVSVPEKKKKRTERKLIRKKIDYEYPYLKQTKIPAKLTATQLGVMNDALDDTTTEGAFYMGLPLFMKNRKSITPKERGDIYHKVMENLDFHGDVSQLDAMRERNVLTDDEASVIDKRQIDAFLTSPLADRIRAASEVKREFPVFTLVNAALLDNPCDEDMSFVQGIADMYFVEDDKIVLVDYKTNRGVTAPQLIEEYHGQLELYAKALTEMTGLEVTECILYSFELNEAIVVRS